MTYTSNEIETTRLSQSDSDQFITQEAIRILKAEGSAILDCAARLSDGGHSLVALQKSVKLLKDTLDDGGKIVVCGIGKSAKIGEKFVATLRSTGSEAIFLHPTEAIHGDMGAVRKNDVIFLLSYTGNTEELLRLIPSLKQMDVPRVGLGGNPDSQLARVCHFWIDGAVVSEACPHNLAPSTSTTVALALCDSIALTLMQLRKFDPSVFAGNHPGGALGRRLHLRVKDLMRAEGEIAVLAPDRAIDEVIVEATEKKLGAVLIAAGPRLMGIITDGDIRRALTYRERFFALQAKDIMNSNPITADPEMMAHSALRLMEDRPSQIAVLPVVNTQGEWKGLLRLHDLVGVF